MKLAVINASFYGQEKNGLPKPPSQPYFEDVEYFLFTNNCSLDDSSWKITTIKITDNLRLAARDIKINIHKYIDADYWLWVDNNCLIKEDPRKLINYTSTTDIAVMPHPERNNIIEEAETILKWLPEQASGLQEQINSYYSEGYVPTDLFETKVLLRKNTAEVINFNEIWWEQLKKFSIRDQISFPYASWKTKMFINTFPGNNSLSKHRHKTKPYIPYWGDIVRV